MNADKLPLTIGEIFHLEPGGDFNTVADGARHRALFRMQPVRSFRGFPLLRFELQVVGDVNAPDDQNLIFGFDLAQRL